MHRIIGVGDNIHRVVANVDTFAMLVYFIMYVFNLHITLIILHKNHLLSHCFFLNLSCVRCVLLSDGLWQSSIY